MVNPTKPKPISGWRNRPYSESAEAATARRRTELWDALNAFVHQSGGWVVSVPNMNRVRIEVANGSSLRTKLSDLGYTPRHCGISTRNVGSEIIPGDIIEISLSVR